MGKYREALGRLGEWFERQSRVLPWRDEPTPYRVWVSEIMLQQTQVVTVVPYFERFLARFPDVGTLARAPLEDVLSQWAGLGYYSRARNLHGAARKLVADGFPTDRAGWEAVPGVGPYTAGAILSIAYNRPEAILDGNVERVLSRVRRVGRQKGDAVFKSRLWRLARAFVRDGQRWARVEPRVLNQALMELGATVCTPRQPRCELCPLAELCRARAAGDVAAYPPRKARKQWIEVEERRVCALRVAVAANIYKVWLSQSPAGRWRAGLWDLPESAVPRAQGVPRGWERLGEIETRHVVTRHRIRRITEVWLTPSRSATDSPSSDLALWKAAESGQDEAGCWVALFAPEVPIGSAAKKTLMRISERYFSG